MNAGYTYKQNSVLDTEDTVLFYCHKGTCTESKGHILVNGKVYTKNAQQQWEIVDTTNSLCTAGNNAHIGNIKKSGTPTIQLCIPKAAEPNPEFNDLDSAIYFLPSGNGVKMYLAGSSNTILATPDPEDGYYYIKDNAIQASVDPASKLVKCKNKSCEILTSIEDGFYVNVMGDELIMYTTSGSQTHSFVTTIGYYLDNESSLVYCDGASCVYTDSIGYFKNQGDTQTNKYIECSVKSGCKAIPEPTAECNSDAQVGHLVKNGRLCLKNGITKEFASSSTQLVYYQSGSVFQYYVNRSAYFGLVKISSTFMTIDFDNTISSWCVSTSTLTATQGTTCTSGSEKYVCNVDGVCIEGRDDNTETLPESIRNKKVEKEKDEEENTSAADFKIECEVLSGKNCKY